MRLAATASAFSEWLASSPYAGEVTPDRLLGYLSGVPEVYGADARPEEAGMDDPPGEEHRGEVNRSEEPQMHSTHLEAATIEMKNTDGRRLTDAAKPGWQRGPETVAETVAERRARRKRRQFFEGVRSRFEAPTEHRNITLTARQHPQAPSAASIHSPCQQGSL